jgi:proteic killer suppression protein
VTAVTFFYVPLSPHVIPNSIPMPTCRIGIGFYQLLHWRNKLFVIPNSDAVGVRNLANEIQESARRKLRMINNSFNINDLSVLSANRPEKLSGGDKDFYSIRINDQWRIIFKWAEGHADQ